MPASRARRCASAAAQVGHRDALCLAAGKQRRDRREVGGRRPHADLGVRNGQARCRCVRIAQPDAQGVRQDRQVGFGQIERRARGHGVAPPTIPGPPVNRCRDLLRGQHRPGPCRGTGARALALATRMLADGGAVPGEPLMLAVGDDDLAGGERHLVTRPPVHDLGGRDDASPAGRPRRAAGRRRTSPIVVQPVGVGSGVSSARALPIAGRAAMTIIWPGCRPLVSASRSAKPVGTPVSAPPRLPMASISSSAPGMISDSGR